MAHVEKFTKGAITGIAKHVDRTLKNHSNDLIDVSKSHLNYDLCNKQGNTLTRMNNRLNEVYMLNRKDVNAGVGWALTLPEELLEKTDQQQKEFFRESYNFLSKRYGKENVISANVHVDETRPHLHFLFIPVVYDEKHQREKVSASEVINRAELRKFHKDLDNYLKEKIPNIYQGGVLNDKTIDVENVKELKELTKQIEKEKAKKIELRKKYSDYNTVISDSKEILDKINFQKSKLSNTYKLDEKDYETIKNISYSGANAIDAYQTLSRQKNKEIKELEKEKVSLNDNLNSIEKDRDKFYNLYDEEWNKSKEFAEESSWLLEENERIINANKKEVFELNRILSKTNEKVFLQETLLNSFERDRKRPLTNLEIKGRLILADLEKGNKPKTIEIAEEQKIVLNHNLEERLIPRTRLEKGIEILKGIINKFKEFIEEQKREKQKQESIVKKNNTTPMSERISRAKVESKERNKQDNEKPIFSIEELKKTQKDIDRDRENKPNKSKKRSKGKGR